MDYRVKSNNAWKAFTKANSIRGSVTFAELHSFTRPLPTHGDTWGNWKYNAESLVLTFVPHNYEIDLERFVNSANALDYIFQVATKRWASPKDLGDLIQAIADLVDPQATLCSFGKNLQFNPTKHLKELNRRSAAKKQRRRGE